MACAMVGTEAFITVKKGKYPNIQSKYGKTDGVFLAVVTKLGQKEK